MSSNTSASPPPIEAISASSSKAKKHASKKPKPSSTKSAPKSATHPSWKDIIKGCLTAHKEDARTGVSRASIKKFAEETYRLDLSGANLYQLNRAITSGVNAGIFALPKGPSGKVKMAPRKKAASDDENPKPVPAKKPVLKKAPIKKVDAVASKKSAVKKPATAPKSKKFPTTKKATTIVGKKPATAPQAKKATPKKVTAAVSPKKPVAKSAAPARRTSNAKITQKKVAAKAAATKATKKPSSKAKPASSRARKVAA